MSFFVDPPILEGKFVRVEPLSMSHAAELYEIGADPSIWKWMPSDHLASLTETERFIAGALAQREKGEEFPFVVIHQETGRLAGCTRYLDISPAHRGLEIGWTFYGTEYQRTPVNTETKRLLLEYAFEVLGAVRVQLKTDSRNLRSQTAIQRIGAKLEGTLRNHRILPKDGYIRDTVYFSILDSEWAGVKEGLDGMLRGG